MNKFSIATFFVSLVVLCTRSGVSFGFAVRRVGVLRFGASCHCSSRRSRSRLSRPVTEPTSISLRLGRSETDKEEAEQSTEEGRASKRKRLFDLARRFRRTFRPFLIGMRRRISIDEGSSLDDASQRNASPIMQIEDTMERTPQVENTLLDDVSAARDVSVQTQKTEEEPIAPIENTLIIPKERQSRSAEHVDLSGTWRPVVTPEFKTEYDSYLANCSQSFLFRKVVVNGIGYQKEVIRQLNDGIDLEIIATNPAGNWNRTLRASDGILPLNVTITDPDGDRVQIEAWWEMGGTRHKSILRGKPNVDGGVFETVRYLETDAVLVCESKFHPSPSSSVEEFKYGYVVWTFQRDQ